MSYQPPIVKTTKFVNKLAKEIADNIFNHLRQQGYDDDNCKKGDYSRAITRYFQTPGKDALIEIRIAIQIQDEENREPEGDAE